jgi:polyisoprenoid-binding protein YceI
VGDLTIRGKTREITLRAKNGGRATDPWGNEKVAFSATGKLNRQDYGLKWNAVLETGGVTVGNEVKIHIEAQLVRQG